MLRALSVFSGAQDLRLALGLLWRAASGAARTPTNAAPLDELAVWYGSESSRQALVALAGRFGLSVDLPPTEVIRQHFADELLSSTALRLHRGRNVYSSSKAALWRSLWLPFRDALTIDEATYALTEELVALRTDADGPGAEAVVALIGGRLRRLGFSVDLVVESGHPPIIRAHRPARGLAGRVALYGHYDVERPEPVAWRTDPWQMAEVDGRLYGVGIGDNKAALAHRLVLMEELERSPELLWLVQGEEEIGSPLAHRKMAKILHRFDPTLYIEENGYFDADGTQRILAYTRAPDGIAQPDQRLSDAIGQISHEAGRFGCRARVEHRGLNKSFFSGGCPFGNALRPGDRYLAIGVNDPASAIHGPNESVPMWTFPLHAAQLRCALSREWPR